MDTHPIPDRDALQFEIAGIPEVSRSKNINRNAVLSFKACRVGHRQWFGATRESKRCRMRNRIEAPNLAGETYRRRV